MRRLLLFSNSTNHKSGYLDHGMESIQLFLGPVKTVVFVPFALRDTTGYTQKARERFAQPGLLIEEATEDAEGLARVAAAEAVFVGGGNSFRLLDRLKRSGILDVLRARADDGMAYLGASAGTNIACPTIRTTNDMPIVEPQSFDALNLVPFQINPHYIDPNPESAHMGETRDTRIKEYLEENERAVVGLREGSWLRVEGPTLKLQGASGGRLFRRGRRVEELSENASLDYLLRE